MKSFEELQGDDHTTGCLLDYNYFKKHYDGNRFKVCARIKHLILPKIQNMMDIKVVLLQWFVNFLIKNKTGGAIKNEIMSNKELAEELQKPIIKIFNKNKSTLNIYRQYLGC